MNQNHDVVITDGLLRLPGTLAIPEPALGVVLFAHGSGSTRHSPRNIQVARVLNKAGLGTLLFDLLTPEEAADRENTFDIPLLSARLVLATTWLQDSLAPKHLPLGYFGASTGAAAAISAACELGTRISAVVSRGGRPDLAQGNLNDLKAPTLLLVGSEDDVVLRLNQNMLPRLAQSQLTIVPGATHLFEEPGTLEEVAEHAKNWFVHHLSARATHPSKRRTHHEHS
ncbi:MAG: dienelactone hydrolase family protein [Deltaproteobacteria bacterium]|nr:dienelactone hydrolase family protein [Deltaproteobacteria bacterium]